MKIFLDLTCFQYLSTYTYTCTLQVLEELKNLDAIAPTKLCLVNGTPKTGLEGSAEELVRIAVNSSLLYMNGQIMVNYLKQ